jgi:SAM-dependent methyltransferase
MKIGSGERRSPIWQVLKKPALYDFVQWIAGTPRIHREFIQYFVRPHKGARVLDVGCGTGDLLGCLNEVEYVGLDFNEDYIATAQERHSSKGAFLVGNAETLANQIVGKFDFILAIGLLHHLDDRGASSLLESISGALTPDGKFFSIDPCFDSTQNALQRWMVSKDRGRAVRTAHGYRDLFPRDFIVQHEVRHNWGNIPWSYCILSATRFKALASLH